jgi:hypothetical protein
MELKVIDKLIVYHGSSMEVKDPKIIQNGFYKDFGYGFYCNIIEKQAKRWALTRNGNSVVNKYSYTIDESLNIKNFAEMTDEWLDFVSECRIGKVHDYDIVEGPMADDQMWNYVEDFISGLISRAAFWEIVKFNHPTHQIVYCTEAALKTLKFEGSDSYEK